MKKGFTIIELMVAIVIMGILAAVAIPKLLGLMCYNDMDRCKVDKPTSYQLMCETYSNSTSTDSHTTAIRNHCNAKSVTQAPVQVTATDIPETIIVHDTIRLIDTVYLNVSYEACKQKCTANNSSQSVIDFCIKEECKN